MSEIHSLIVRHGRLKARELVTPDEKRYVNIAAKILEEESQALGITYSGFCMTSLPHKRLPDDQIWERHAGRFSLLVEPGYLRVNREAKQFGVPYGSRARLILVYLQSRAIQTDSPDVKLGGSMREWMQRMGVVDSGKNYTLVRDQANRISACRLSFFWDEGAGERFEKDHIVKGGIYLKSADADEQQGSLWQESVRLGDTFFRALKAHPVPIYEPALRLIANQSLTIDIYLWLSYRLWTLKAPTPLTWSAIHGQFGAGYRNLFQFKPRFLEALRMALTVYPEARVDFDIKAGLVLHPSRPPVPERQLAG